jgi:hypothetical protein
MSKSSERCASCLAAFDDALAVVAAVGHLHLFDRRIDAVRRGDERGSLGAHVAVRHRAPGFDQLGSHHDVDVAGLGVSEARFPAPSSVFLAGKISR